ncbi:hypothetical protein V8D89_002325 [Ganoderma adspersum]
MGSTSAMINTQFVEACIVIAKISRRGVVPRAVYTTPCPAEHSSLSVGSRSVAANEFSVSQDATPPIPSELEAKNYYSGLPSRPVLVARTSTAPWEVPKGPEAFPTPKELRIVDNPALAELWHTEVARQVHAVLDSKGVKWGSTSIVRIDYVGDANPPVILWIGVWPKTLSAIAGHEVALACKAVLVEHGIEDVEVEIRESRVARSAGPKLFKPGLKFDPAAEFRICLTPTLGLTISNAATPWAEGTGGFFIASGGADNKVFLVTARHVVFESDKDDNTTYEGKNAGAPRQDVVLLGDQAYRNLTLSIMVEIGKKGMNIQTFKNRLEAVEGKEGREFDGERTHAQSGIAAAEDAIVKLTKLHEEAMRWEKLEDRVIGHVVYAPPVTLGADPGGYTEDFALIEIDTSRFDASNVKINCIDLGTKINAVDLISMMHTSPPTFDYPTKRLLPLRDTIPVEEMWKPTTLDRNGDHCIVVLKRGRSSGLTVGRASGIDSYVRYYDDDGDSAALPYTSRAWTIIPYDRKSGAFSEKGDSGSVVVDGRGRIGGLLTGGDGNNESLDMTYVTPIDFLLGRIKAWEGAAQAHLNPQLY